MREPAVLTAGHLLARNTLLNLLGQGAPLLIALVAIPVLISGLGTERFGVLTLAWMAIGYFSLFDLGLSRALTQLVAERLGRGEEREIPELAWTALLLMLLLGLAGAVLLAVISPWLVEHALQIPDALHREALHAFYLLAFALPWVISTAALRGLLEAQQRFGLINAMRIPLGILTFAGPLLVLPFSSSLVPIVAVLVVGRVISWLAHLLLCLRALPLLRRTLSARKAHLAPLLRFGGWMTVSNLISPIMVYLDRFLIGALVSMSAVAYYVTPYEVVTRLWLIPAALLAVLFPAFATSFRQDRARTALLFDRGLRIIFLILFPLTLVVVTLAHEGLELWLGAEFANQGSRVLQWLAIGVFINSMGQVAFAVVQGVGRPDITGKLHLAELPVYLAALWWLIGSYGIEGVAIAWTVRVSLDTLALFVVSERLVAVDARQIRRIARLVVPAVAVLGFAALLSGGTTVKIIFLALGLGTFMLTAWRHVLGPGERALLRSPHDWMRGQAAPS